MPRKARLKSNVSIYHVMLRGINQQQIFFDDEDNQKFVELLNKYKAVSGFTLYAYCLMGNHVHLLIRVNNEPLEQIIKRLGGAYALWYNMKYERTGHLFQDRFRSEAIEDRVYFLTVLRYIIWNPKKAGLCVYIDEYRYSSGREYLCGAHGITDVSSVVDAVGRKELITYLQEKPVYSQTNTTEKCRKRCTDARAQELIKNEFGTMHPDPGNAKNREMFNRSIYNLYKQGISIRQLSRLTGITKGIIEKALRKGKDD